MAAESLLDFQVAFENEHGVKPSLQDVWYAAWRLAEEKFNSAPAANQQLKAEIFRLHKVAIGPSSEAYIDGWNACLAKVCEKLSAV